MKFSPSSSTSTSFSANFCTGKGNSVGCFSGFLSRILISKTQQTYPSETETHPQFSKIEKILDGSGTPNVVARLMGLEYVTEISSKDDHKGWNSVFRSKSMDSGDSRAKTEEMQGGERRVKTSFSFRETPNYLEVEDDDFFVLSFEEKSQKKKSEVGIKHRRREKCRKKQRKNREEKPVKNRVFSDEERVSLKISHGFESGFDVLKQSYHLYTLKEKIGGEKEDEEDGIKLRKNEKKENCLEEGSKSEEMELESYSPVSVLDDCEFISDPEVTLSSVSEEDAKSRGSECDSKELSCSSNGSPNLNEKNTQENEENKVRLKTRDYRKHENIEMLSKVCRLAETEFNNSNWKYRRMLNVQELDDTGLDFSQQIFDQLISEFVDKLVRIGKC